MGHVANRVQHPKVLPEMSPVAAAYHQCELAVEVLRVRDRVRSGVGEIRDRSTKANSGCHMLGRR